MRALSSSLTEHGRGVGSASQGGLAGQGRGHDERDETVHVCQISTGDAGA